MTILDKRIGLLFAVFLALLSIAFLRALYLGTAKGSTLREAAAVQQVATSDVPARRGSILDRKGVELAVSEPAADVSATPYLVKDAVKTAEKLAPLLVLPVDELVKKLARRDTGFVYLAREVPGTKAEAIRKAGLAGITVEPRERREYPRGFLASQVLGTVGTDEQGLSGLEYRYHDQLQGTDGKRTVTKDALGDTIKARDLKAAKDGKDLRLTIDAAIQDKTEQVLHDIGAKYTPKGATAVVLDPRSNEVLALANWPRVDANAPGEAPEYARQNRAVGFNYEPGSTFKAFPVAGALEEGKVTPDTPFDLPPQIQVADRTIGESHPRGAVTLSTGEILAQSSNVGAIKIGMSLEKAGFDRWVRRFGFGRPTGVDLPGEERGQVLRVDQYSGSSMGNLPIGQGESVTPMQIAAAYSAIANGGILRAPRVVKAIGGRPVKRPHGKRIISEKTATELRTMLKGVFKPGGTAAEVALPGYDLAGKTGTANKIDPKTGLYSQASYVASFVGFAPAAKPELLISVMVDEPKGAIYGGEVAAPAFGKIASFALQYLKIPPQ